MNDHLDVALASRDYWAEEYQRAAIALNDRPTYYHRAVEVRAWAAYLAAERRVAECLADRDGVCYPPLGWLGQPVIRTDRRHHNRAIQALQEMPIMCICTLMTISYSDDHFVLR